MNIKDPEVHRMARELAARQGTSLTGAVRQALKAALTKEVIPRDDISDRLLELGATSRTISEPLRGDSDLYDDVGLPR
ncbi:hypothetical protein BH23ACT6_BH23ACT6_11190 [soil metagenome]